MSGAVLASWNEGSAKSTVLDFVRRVTTEGPDFVPVADRVASFDNDGTLWVEQPLPPQFDFVFRTWAQEIQADPALAGQQPYKAIIEKDPAFFQGVATQDPQAEPFDEFDVRPLSLAVHQLGNNGTARTLLKAWPLTT